MLEKNQKNTKVKQTKEDAISKQTAINSDINNLDIKGELAKTNEAKSDRR